MTLREQVLAYFKAQAGAKAAIDVQRALGGERSGSVSSAIVSLVDSGSLRRVGRGLYEVADPQRQPALPTSTFRVTEDPPVGAS